MKTQKKCAELVADSLAERLEDLRRIMRPADNLSSEEQEELREEFCEYGLSFDYVDADTFDNQPDGYFRFQLSWGGPADEFRFYVGMDQRPYRIEYWYLDWNDGAKIYLADDDFDLLAEWLDEMEGLGQLDEKYEAATEAQLQGEPPTNSGRGE